jgi:hypothetical protein
VWSSYMSVQPMEITGLITRWRGDEEFNFEPFGYVERLVNLDSYPRALTDRERGALAHLLAVDDPRVEPLRQQLRFAFATGKCDCGCATVNLAVNRARAVPATGFRRNPVIETRTLPGPERQDLECAYELLLFLKDGWLSMMEIVYTGNTIPAKFPPASEWGAPTIPE